MTHELADTTLERIIRMVQEAQAEKPPTQRFVETWQQPYVLAVFTASFFVFVGSWTLVSRDFADAFYHSMVMLVAASPCAVIASSPAVVLSAIARAARHGVLFKRGLHVETLGRVTTIAFDKTGTVTPGKPRLMRIWSLGAVDEDRLLELVASVEQHSEHHLGQPIIAEAARRGLALQDVTDFDSHPGQGIHGRVGGVWVWVGREALFESHQIEIPGEIAAIAEESRAQGETALLAVIPELNGGGVFAVADAPRPEAAQAIGALKQMGIEHVVLLTGDHQRVADAIAKAVGADDVRAQLMPDEKVLALHDLIARGGAVAMVGDGVNDAPALASASVGIAMGGAGTDVALEVADVVLMRDDLRELPFAVWLSRRARQHIHENIGFSLIMIGVLVLSSFLGLPLWLAVIGHEGSTVLVVLNGLRILGERSNHSRPALH
jgi:Cd2+/Zn2+-exporting ATPase